MKRVLLISSLVWLAAVWMSEGQTVTTQTASNNTSSSAVLRGIVNPEGSNTLCWFEWGTTTSLGTVISNKNIGAGTTNVNITALLGGQPEGTRLYYCAAASNAVNGIVKGATENFVTTQVSYEFSGLDFSDIDITRPFGGESGSVWDDALRQTKAWTVGFLQTEHADGGVHQPGFLTTTYIQDGAVTYDKLSASLQSMITSNAVGTNAIVGVLVTNALTYHASVEADGTEYQLTTQERALGTSSIASNGFRKVKVTALVFLKNFTGDRRSYVLRVKTGGVARKEFADLKLMSYSSALQSVWAITDGGQTADTSVEVTALSDRSSPHSGLTATLKCLMIEGIP